MTDTLTANRSRMNPRYFIIRINGRAWRICHEANLSERWPGITITTVEDSA